MDTPLQMQFEQPSAAVELEPLVLPIELRDKLRRCMLRGVLGPCAPQRREEQKGRARLFALAISAWHLVGTVPVFSVLPDEARVAAVAVCAHLIFASVLLSPLVPGSTAQTFGSAVVWRDVLPAVLEQLEQPLRPHRNALQCDV
jgi:hypothetical protein